MGRRPVLSVIALAVAVIGSAPAASAAKKPTTTTTTLSPREARIRELRDLVGEASEQEAGLLNEVADIESRLDQLDDAVADLTKQSTAAQSPARARISSFSRATTRPPISPSGRPRCSKAAARPSTCPSPTPK